MKMIVKRSRRWFHLHRCRPQVVAWPQLLTLPPYHYQNKPVPYPMWRKARREFPAKQDTASLGLVRRLATLPPLITPQVALNWCAYVEESFALRLTSELDTLVSPEVVSMLMRSFRTLATTRGFLVEGRSTWAELLYSQRCFLLKRVYPSSTVEKFVGKPLTDSIRSVVLLWDQNQMQRLNAYTVEVEGLMACHDGFVMKEVVKAALDSIEAQNKDKGAECFHHFMGRMRLLSRTNGLTTKDEFLDALIRETDMIRELQCEARAQRTASGPQSIRPHFLRVRPSQGQDRRKAF